MNAAIEWANGLAGHWARGMWPVLWQTAVLAALIGLIVLTARRMSPALRFWLWMLVPLRLLVMPLIVVTLPVLANPPAVQPKIAVAPPSFASSAREEAPAPDWTAPAARPSIAVQTHARASLWTWLMAGWIAGVGFFALRLARGWLRMRAIAKQARENSDARVRDEAREAAAMLGLRKTPRIMAAAEGASPFVLGFLRPVVVLPAALADHVSPEELRTVLAHEFAHVRRRDALAGWVLACADVLYFFNPVVHLVKRAIILERERACDEQVLALAKAPRAVYARALLSASALSSPAATRPTCAPVLLESSRHLERRLKSIAAENRPSAALSRTARLCLVVISALALPGITCTQRDATASAAPAASTPNEISDNSSSPARTDNSAEVRTYDVIVPEDWKDKLSVGKLSLIGSPFYGVPWDWGLWTVIHVQFPLKNLTATTLYEEVSYRTESDVEGCSNAEMGFCYTLKPGEERLIDAIAPIASTERPVKFLLRLWDPAHVAPVPETRWRVIGLTIDPLPVAKPPVPGEKIDITQGNGDHFAIGDVRLKDAKSNFLFVDVENKTDKPLPLGISVGVNDPRNVENDISPVPREHGAFSSQVTIVDARSKTTVGVPYDIKPVGANLLLAFSIFEPRQEYATYGQRDTRSRDVTLVAWGAADLAKAAARGECVIPQPTSWTVVPTLDVPGLRPPAVQYAIFDQDPVPEFKKKLSRMHAFNAARLAQAKDDSSRVQERGMQMAASWNLGFRDHRGDEIGLLASDPGTTIFGSNAPAGKKWFVTKFVTLGNKVLCWSIPFEAVQNCVVKITLTEKNALDLGPIYDEVMSQGTTVPAAPAEKPK